MSTSDFSTFGIVGHGHIGRFFARSFTEHGDVVVTDTDASRLDELDPGVRAAPLIDVLRADVAVLAVPFEALADVLGSIRDDLRATTVVMDVTSTKARATELLRTTLDGHPNLLATHPLFGPPSMERIAPGQRLVVTLTEGPRAKELRDFFATTCGLDIVELSADDHDRAMAYMQALPFFIARALADLDIAGHLPDPAQLDALAIPSFEKLRTIVDIEAHHTPGMFETSQRSNPYAGNARRHLLRALEQLQRELST